MIVKIINKSNHRLPEYKTSGSAGFDLKANIATPISISHEETIIVPTGLYMEIPKGYEVQIRPRSGLAAKEGLVAILGTIDSDYRGEIGVILYNTKEKTIINPGDRIAQGVLCPVEQAEWKEVSELESSDRGEGGFGSTGV